MKNSHSGAWVGIAVLFIAAVYSVVVFLVKPVFDLTAWVVYGATMTAFLLAGIQAIAFSRSGSAVVMDTVLRTVTAVYVVVQFIGGIIFMCLSDVPPTPVMIGEMILLAVYLVTVFLMYAAQSSSSKQDCQDRNAVQKMRLLENDVRNMMDEAADPKVKNALRELSEAIHYSDIVSLPGLADVEERIAQNMAVLQDELTDRKANPLARIETLRRLLRERDRTAAVLKG